MLQQDEPDDYVLATGVSHTVRDFVELAFYYTGRPIEWQGEGLSEVGIDKGSGHVLVKVDPRYFRPNEVVCLRGDAQKARTQLGWKPRTSFRQLVREMVEFDLKHVDSGGRLDAAE